MHRKSRADRALVDAPIMMPHAFPFRLADRAEADGSRRILLTQNAASMRGRADYPALLAIEALAQASLLSPAGGEGSPEAPGTEVPATDLRLAGLDRVVFADELETRPLVAGDVLLAELSEVGSFGKLRKLEGRLLREGVPVIEAVLLLAVG